MKSIYIHIPFCNHICSYCDFSKLFYNKDLVSKYLLALEKEIESNYKNEKIKTLYIGGGTPSSLNINELEKLFKIIKKIKLDNEYEFTFECNIESLTEEKIKFLFKNSVNRLSIGVQTFNDEYLKYLNRFHNKDDVFNIVKYAKKYFNNINIDLIYGIKNQTLDELKNDIDLFLKLDINHISTYSLLIEPHTKLFIEKEKNIDEELEYEMYKYIRDKLEENNFVHYEVSNFGKLGYESKHNLTYWNNKEYYGFGLGASGFVNGIRYTNTKNINKYLNGEFSFEIEKIDEYTNMQNEMILGLRKIKGVNMNEFYDKYNKKIEDVFKIDDLIKEGKLKIENGSIYIPKEYIYLSNEILINFIGDCNE